MNKKNGPHHIQQFYHTAKKTNHFLVSDLHGNRATSKRFKQSQFSEG